MKRVYMNLAGTYYKVQQSFDRILETVIPRRNAISSREDSVMNTVSISISASDMDYSNLMTNERWQKVELFRRQKKLLDTFLQNGAIAQAQYDKSFGDLRDLMEMHGVE